MILSFDSSAAALASAGGRWCALLDRRRVVRLERSGVVALGELPVGDGQSVALLADGSVAVGRTGARLAVVGADGTVRGLNPVSGDRRLRGAAIEAVQQWHYKPYLVNGTPVDFETTVTINFTLPQSNQ